MPPTRSSFDTVNVDPLIRQITLGHAPEGGAPGGGPGMTAVYTHTRLETQRREILRAVRLRPESLTQEKRFLESITIGREVE
ncbi:MAG: hypothetical protein ACLQNE_08125 [Thermoguttaceae bacterium]|jgi:hypothetical protein